jgi:hypothetical protein
VQGYGKYERVIIKGGKLVPYKKWKLLLLTQIGFMGKNDEVIA